MKLTWLIAFAGITAATFPAWASAPPRPGTLNYVEGEASLNGKAVTDRSIGAARLRAGDTLSTQNGRAEILLTPGIFFRVDDHSSVRMVTTGRADNVMALDSGRAIVEVDLMVPANNVRVVENGVETRLLKAGLYDFDANRKQIRVFDGKAMVQAGPKNIELKGDREVTLNAAKLKAKSFDKKQAAGDFYRWSSMRSSYLAEANVDEARNYAVPGGYSPNMFYGDGWYWDPWYGAYTFIPADGIFYDPFGWGFYSPWFAPYVGFGYGFGGFGYFHGPHHFGPGYHPAFAPSRSVASSGHAVHFGGRGMSGFSRSVGSARGGGFAAHAGGFHGGGFGGGFHGGGFGGGGRGR